MRWEVWNGGEENSREYLQLTCELFITIKGEGIDPGARTGIEGDAKI
jgi:hypothetical protein